MEIENLLDFQHRLFDLGETENETEGGKQANCGKNADKLSTRHALQSFQTMIFILKLFVLDINVARL